MSSWSGVLGSAEMFLYSTPLPACGCNILSWNHRKIHLERDLRQFLVQLFVFSSPAQVAQGIVWAGPGALQGWRLHNLPGKSPPVLLTFPLTAPCPENGLQDLLCQVSCEMWIESGCSARKEIGLFHVFVQGWKAGECQSGHIWGAEVQGMWLKGLQLCRTDLIRLKGHAPSSSFRLFPLIVSHSLQNFFILTVCEAKWFFR